MNKINPFANGLCPHVKFRSLFKNLVRPQLCAVGMLCRMQSETQQMTSRCVGMFSYEHKRVIFVTSTREKPKLQG